MSTLINGIQDFTKLALEMSDADLERKWVWKDYDGEGFRFAFFRTLEDLLALESFQLHRRKKTLSQAQQILAGYHLAFRDLQASLLGVDESDYDRIPMEGEWPPRRVLDHIVQADLVFYAVIKHGIKSHRMGDGKLSKLTDKIWEEVTGTTDPELDKMLAGPIEAIISYHEEIHVRTLAELSDISDEELQKTALFWEKEAMTIRFRLHRFESHLRQHTIQMDKALDMLDLRPTEIKRLLRLIYNGLARAETAMMGINESSLKVVNKYRKSIEGRTAEIRQLFEK